MSAKGKKSRFKLIWTALISRNERMEAALPRELSGLKFMCKACELAKVVTNECYAKNCSVSAAKLQKLLVLMHGEHLAKYGTPLFPENVVRWSCGVAIKEVELKFLLHDFSKKERLPEQIAILKTEEHIINRILDSYGDMDVIELNKDARLNELTTQYPFIPEKHTIIPTEDIKKVFMNYGEDA